MRHLTISSFGVSLGVTGERLVVTENGEIWETALSRLRTIRVEKEGVSISSNLILACAARGIRLYFLDWRGIGIAAVAGLHQHAVVKVREAQFECIHSQEESLILAREIVFSKVRNQRAVLLYFSKYSAKTSVAVCEQLRRGAALLEDVARELLVEVVPSQKNWRNVLLGLEGVAATLYWKALRETELLPKSFFQREGRGSVEIGNSALNYGYAILQSYVWSALDNAGLELYAGLFHVKRPGKPSLVLDFMEEYRAWVVDRNIIKLRHKLEDSAKKGLTIELKKIIVEAVDKTMATPLYWHKKSLRLENILQRQAYRLAGAIVDKKAYRGIRFRW